MKLFHTPGDLVTDMDPAKPGQMVVRAKTADSVYPFARCGQQDAALIALAKTAPHDCDHVGCPGPVLLARLQRVDAIVAASQSLVTAFGAFSYQELVTGVGQARADAVWAALAALRAATPQ